MNALIAEWTRLHSSTQLAFSRIFTTITVAAAGLGYVIANLKSIQDSDAAPVVFIALPLVYTVVFSLMIEQLWLMVFEGYQIRRLEEKLGKLSHLPEIFVSNRALVIGHYSVRTGPRKRLISYAVLFLAVAAAYFGILIYSVRGLLGHTGIPWQTITLLVCLDILVISLVIFSFASSLLDSRSSFKRALAKLGVPMSPSDVEASPFPLFTFISDGIKFFVLPRPLDFLVKGQIFWIGFLVVASQLYFVNRAATVDLIDWEDVWVATLVFLLIEFGANQTKYILNDTQDRFDDVDHPVKCGRFPAKYSQQPFTPHICAALFGLRTSLVVALAAFISSRYPSLAWAVPVIGLIFIHQVIYDARFKRSDNAWAKTWFASASYVIRACSGVAIGYELLPVSFSSALAAAAFSAVWIVAFENVALGGWWRAEAESNSARAFVADRPSLDAYRHEGLHNASLVGLAGVSLTFPIALSNTSLGWPELRELAIGGLVGVVALVLAARIPTGSKLVPGFMLLGLTAGALGVAATVSGWGRPHVIWPIAFPVFADAWGVFFRRADLEQLVVHIPLDSLKAFALRAYDSMFNVNGRRAPSPRGGRGKRL